MTQKFKNGLLYFLILVYVSGTIGFLARPDFFLPFTPFTLLLTVLVFLIHQNIKFSRLMLGFLVMSLIGFVIEVIGVATGKVFGPYVYGETLGSKLAGVPLTISLNWALLVNAGALIGQKLVNNKTAAALICASIATGIDFLIEQIAPAFDFWYFENHLAGLQNYIAWFLISFLLAFLWLRFIGEGNERIAAWILGLQVLFFGTLVLISFS